MSGLSILADVNVWLATLVDSHPHHARSISWWRRQVLREEATVVFCRVTQLGLLRLLTNDKVMGSQTKSLAEAWAVMTQLLAQSPVSFVREPDGLDEILAAHCALGGSSSRFWTDAYLAAFAEADGLALATFDRGFRRFPNLDLRLLSSRGGSR